MVGRMTVDEPASHPDLAQAVIAQGLANQEQAAREAEQLALVNNTFVPPETIDRMLEVWIKARRLDEGMTRPIKPDQLADQIRLTKMNHPLLKLIRAAYRAGLYDGLYPSDQEDPT